MENKFIWDVKAKKGQLMGIQYYYKQDEYDETIRLDEGVMVVGYQSPTSAIVQGDAWAFNGGNYAYLGEMNVRVEAIFPFKVINGNVSIGDDE